MSEKHLDKVSFEFIRYANCWEDADVLLEGLQINENSAVMSIASAGDNCFSLLSKSPKKVVAVDISEVQLFLVELKRAVIRNFNHQDFLTFLGFKEGNNRIEQFNQIKTQLSEKCQYYWENNLAYIENGVIHQGKFENYFQLFKNDVLPTVHNRDIVDELFLPKNAADQLTFHDEKWNTEEWKKMYRHFFGVEMMGTHGRDPEFLKHVKGSVPDLILAREVAHLSTPRCQRNYFLYYILNNSFHPDFLPHYAREENYEAIKNNLDKLVLHHGLLDSALQAHPNCTHFNLSDIFEYMDTELFRTVATDILDHSAENARIGYWNLMIPRYISNEFPNRVDYLKETSERLKEEDLGYFYGNLVFEEKK